MLENCNVSLLMRECLCIVRTCQLLLVFADRLETQYEHTDPDVAIIVFRLHISIVLGWTGYT